MDQLSTCIFVRNVSFMKISILISFKKDLEIFQCLLLQKQESKAYISHNDLTIHLAVNCEIHWEDKNTMLCNVITKKAIRFSTCNFHKIVPVPVGKGHHDIKGSQEKHEVKKGITVSDTILFIIYSSVHIISILQWSITSGSTIFYQCWFITC